MGVEPIIDFLNRCQAAYYRGEPIISDDEFDYLADKYSFYEVGSTPILNKAKHMFPMYSLQKIYAEDNTDPLSEHEVVKTPKLDGAAISLLYVNGVLVKGITRGDGVEGEDITEKVYKMELIPKKVFINSTIQVSGEIVAPKTVENARNYASGALHLKSIVDFIPRTSVLEFFAYAVQPLNLTSTYVNDMEFLRLVGFKTVYHDNCDLFPQDGSVVRINTNSTYNILGNTAKHPKGAYAIKKRSDVEVKETKLLDVVWQVGKGGKVTPVAIFEEIVIEDAKINRATLHNPGFIEDMDLSIGDTILVTRSGGIIPKVIGKI